MRTKINLCKWANLQEAGWALKRNDNQQSSCPLSSFGGGREGGGGWVLIQCWAPINFPPYRMGTYLRLDSQNTNTFHGIKLKRECFISHLEKQVGKSRYNCTAKFFLTYI